MASSAPVGPPTAPAVPAAAVATVPAQPLAAPNLAPAAAIATVGPTGDGAANAGFLDGGSGKISDSLPASPASTSSTASSSSTTAGAGLSAAPGSLSSSTSAAGNGAVLKMKIKKPATPNPVGAPEKPKKHKSKKHKGEHYHKRKDLSSNPCSPASPASKDTPPPPSFYSGMADGPAGGRLESLLKKVMSEPPSKRIKVGYGN